MRRWIALFLMLIVPVQFACSAEQGVRGHVGEDAALVGFHMHDNHDHHHDHAHEPTTPDPMLLTQADQDPAHNSDGHHERHFHPVFSFLIIEPGLKLAALSQGGPILCPPASFVSRVPPLFERPPTTRI